MNGVLWWRKCHVAQFGDIFTCLLEEEGAFLGVSLLANLTLVLYLAYEKVCPT
jgi:hypothetical protein